MDQPCLPITAWTSTISMVITNNQNRIELNLAKNSIVCCVAAYEVIFETYVYLIIR